MNNTRMKQTRFILKTTADGSDTLFSAEMDESYHSVNGAAQESRHVYIDAGLRQVRTKSIRIFEIGFGTGLNALLTWGEAQKSDLDIVYEAIEAFPVSMEQIQCLNYGTLEPALPAEAFMNLHQSPWDKPVQLAEGRFSLLKRWGDFTSLKLEETYDLIYFDAFAPDKQPEMWEEAHFRKIINSLNDEGILVTYCAKGEVRRRLQRSGFQVERIPGPPGKREMLRARKG